MTLERGLDTAAPVVTTDDDMFHLQELDGELNDRETIQVGVHDQVGNITMNE
jgi:hypothetical protein